MGKAPVDAVETSLKVLRLLEEQAPCTVTEIAERLGRPKATVYYHLQTLTRRGYVVRRDDRYEVGLRVLELAGRARQRRTRMGVVESNLKRLSKVANEIAVFGLAERGSAVVVKVERPPGPTTDIEVTIGTHLPLHASALGKALLSEYSDERLDSVLGDYEFEQYTPDTVEGESAFRDELSTVRADGHATDHGERDPDVHGVAAPLTAVDGSVPGTIGVVGPASRLYSDRFAHELPHLVERFAERVEHELRS